MLAIRVKPETRQPGRAHRQRGFDGVCESVSSVSVSPSLPLDGLLRSTQSIQIEQLMATTLLTTRLAAGLRFTSMSAFE
jgi:hypothetical protein